MNQWIGSMMLIAASGLGAGRIIPTAAAMLGLIGAVLGGLSLRRRHVNHSSQLGARVAAVAGLIGLVVGGLHTLNSAGGFGTGNGLAGALAAIGLGAVSIVLGSLGMRLRRLE